MTMYYRRDLFFFFKQKTAYEMRISDWSSDVCSSDLAGDAVWLEGAGDRGVDVAVADSAADAARVGAGAAAAGGAGAGGDCRLVHPRTAGDRKSVVLGKSMSVRVDLVFRRILTIKNNFFTLLLIFFSFHLLSFF